MKAQWTGQHGTSLGVVGLSELYEAMKEFPGKVGKRIMNRALKDAANVMVHAARVDAPKRTGVLRNSIRATTVRQGRIGPVLLVVVGGKRERTKSRKIRTPGGMAKVKFKRVDDAFYAPWVEFGTDPHEITAYSGKALSFGGRLSKKVQHPGSKGSSFFRRAIDRSSVHATDTFLNRVTALLSQARSTEGL